MTTTTLNLRSKKGLIQYIKEKATAFASSLDNNVKAELEYLFEEYATNPKEVTKEDLDVAIKSMAKQGVPFPELTKKAPATKEVTVEHSRKTPTKAVEKVEAKTQVKATTKKPSKKYELHRTEILAEFPQTITVNEELGEMTRCDDIQNLGDLAKAIEDNRNIYILTFWSKRALRQFNYDALWVQENDITEFPMDLDVSHIVYSTDKIAYAVSLYTEVMTPIMKRGFEADEDYVRYTDGTAFQIYETK